MPGAQHRTPTGKENPMPKYKEEVTWSKLNTARFTGQLLKAYDAYLSTVEDSKLARETLEEIMVKKLDVPKGKKATFSYRWGTLSFGYVSDTKAGKTDNGGVVI